MPQVHRVTVTGAGPYGSLEELTYEINLADMRETLDQPDGSLHLVRKALDQLRGQMKERGDLRVEVVSLPESGPFTPSGGDRESGPDA
jgi:hypothetical protein